MSDEITAVAETTATETPSTETTSTPTETTSPSTETTSTTETASEQTEVEWKAPARQPGEDSRAYLSRARAEKEKWIASGKKPQEVATEAAKPAEPAKVEDKPQDKTEEKKEVAEDKTQDTPQDDFDELVGIATSELAAKLKDNPELEKQLEASGLKNQVFANARLADMANQYREEFPGGIEDAKFAKQQSQTWAEMDDAFSGVQDIPTFAGFVQKAIAHSYVLDENGEPLKDEKGNPVPDGTVGRFVENAVGYGAAVYPKGVAEKLLGNEKGLSALVEAGGIKSLFGSEQGREALLQEIQSLGTDQDEELNAALEIFKERMQSRSTSSAKEETSAEARKVAEERQKLEAERNALDQRKAADQKQTVEQQDRAIATDMSNSINKVLDSFMGRYTWGTDFEKDAARKEIEKLTYERMKSDAAFAARAGEHSRRQYSKTVHEQRVGMSVAAFKAHLPHAAKAVLEKAGVKLLSQQESKANKIDTQIKASKAEPKGGLSVPGAKPVLTNEEIGKQARENLYKQGKDPSDSGLLLAEMRRIRSGQ